MRFAESQIKIMPIVSCFKGLTCPFFISLRKLRRFRDATRQWFPREMTSEKRAQKFHNDDASLQRSGRLF